MIQTNQPLQICPLCNRNTFVFNLKTLQVVIERYATDEVADWIEENDYFLLTTIGDSEQEVIDNLQGLVVDCIAHESTEFDEWRDVDANQIVLEVIYK